MVTERKPSAATCALLFALLEFPIEEGTWGRNLAAASGLAGGTVYPILTRLEQRGVVESADEQIDPAEEGRPARRYWRFTFSGVEYARSLRAELDANRRHAVTASGSNRALKWGRLA
jgi:PadR family transcriptional regulator, regulatory protein PadR